MNEESEVENRFEVLDAYQFKDEEWSKDTKEYGALEEHVDGYVGRMEKMLDSLGIAKNTITIFTSDNDAVNTSILENNGDLKSYKLDLYEGGIRVPVIVKWPKVIKENEISNHISDLYDFFPTLCDVAGVKDYPKTNGISLLPELKGEKQSEHEYLYWEFDWLKPKRTAIRYNRWKGVLNAPDADWEV